MSGAIRVERHGGPEALKWESVTVPRPGAREVRLRQTFVGLNFIDVYQRSGLYPMPLPFVPGNEAAGVVVETGAEVSGLRAGDRVAYASVVGAYAEERIVPAEKLVKLPDGVPDDLAAAMMLK